MLHNWEEIQTHHATFIHLFNTTAHWAHRARDDGRKTPESVLGGELGRRMSPDALRRAFRQLQFPRTVNRLGCVSVQRFYLYAEQGLAKRRVSVWIYADRLHIEYQQNLLARYTCTVDRQRKSLTSVTNPNFYRTSFASSQLEFFELDDEQWLKVRQRSRYSHSRRQKASMQQLPLLGAGAVFA